MKLKIGGRVSLTSFGELLVGELFVGDGQPYPSKKTGVDAYAPICDSDGGLCSMTLHAGTGFRVRRVASLTITVE